MPPAAPESTPSPNAITNLLNFLLGR
jgi:hypothetical protein